MQRYGKPLGYNSTQIVLHWLIAALLIFQIVMGEQIVPAYRAFRKGMEASADDLLNADIHVYVGVAVLVLAILRLAIRFGRGAPAAPAEEGAVQRGLASLTHIALYVIMIGMPVTGMLAWYLGVAEMGEIHEAAKLAIVLIVALHAAGALWQHFVARNDVLLRILRPEGPK